MSAMLKELASLLDGHGVLPCSVEVAPDDDGRSLEFTVRITPPIGLMALALRSDLEYLQGLDQVRAFAEKYEIPSAALEQLLPRRQV